MAKYLANYVADCRSHLQEDHYWTDGQLEEHIYHALRELSRYIPYEQETVLPVVDDDKEVDISSLDGLVYIPQDRGVEFYPDRSDRKWRNHTKWGDYLTLGIDFDPDVTGSTLTGKVTFAATVDVTGLGTSFEDEVEAGDYIKNSADTEWAKVRSVTDNTNLVLARAYAGTTGVDTEDETPARTYKEVVRIYWGGMHTVAAAATTIPTEHEQLIIEGACAYALLAWASEGRKRIAAGTDYLGTGEDYIPTVNVGENVPGGYGGYTGLELSSAGLILQYQREGWARLARFNAALRQNRTPRVFRVHSRSA